MESLTKLRREVRYFDLFRGFGKIFSCIIGNGISWKVRTDSCDSERGLSSRQAAIKSILPLRTGLESLKLNEYTKNWTCERNEVLQISAVPLNLARRGWREAVYALQVRTIASDGSVSAMKRITST